MFHLTNFHLFPLLPTELRLKIWSLTIEPRLLTILDSECVHRNAVNYSTSIRCTPHPPTSKPPALLSTTRESRSVGLASYTAAFPLTLGTGHLTHTYVNYALDVFMCFSHLLGFGLRCDDLKSIRNLIVRTRRDGFHDAKKGNAFAGPSGLLSTEGMREITVVLLEGEESQVFLRSIRANEMLLRDEFKGREGLEVTFLRRGGEGGVSRGVRTRAVWGLVEEVLEMGRVEEAWGRMYQMIEDDGLP